MMAGLSKWADFWLQQLRTEVPTYLKDSGQLLELLGEIGTLPPGARLFTADAVSMYTNIETKHGLEVIKAWLSEFSDELPDNFPVMTMNEALKLVLQNNIFEFGDSFLNNLAAVQWERQSLVFT